jgi:hypothetical protein
MIGKIPASAKTIFVEFAVRNSLLTREQADYEVKNYLTVNGQIRQEASYLTVRRVDAPFTLDRIQRKAIYLLFANAINHSTFSTT